MKARIPSNHRDLSAEETAMIEESLKFFIETESFEGVTAQRKSLQDKLATATLEKIQKQKFRYNAEEMRIIYVSLLNFQISIETIIFENRDKDLINQFKPCLPTTNRLIAFFEDQFRAAGHDID